MLAMKQIASRVATGSLSLEFAKTEKERVQAMIAGGGDAWVKHMKELGPEARFFTPADVEYVETTMKEPSPNPQPVLPPVLRRATPPFQEPRSQVAIAAATGTPAEEPAANMDRRDTESYDAEGVTSTFFDRVHRVLQFGSSRPQHMLYQEAPPLKPVPVA